MQHFSNPVIALMKGSLLEQFLILKKKNVFVIIISLPFQQTFIPVSIVGSTWNLVEIGKVVSEGKLLNNIMVLYMYTAQGQGR